MWFNMQNNKVQTIASSLAQTGWIELRNFLSSHQIQSLRQLARFQQQQDNFRQAGIGSNQQRTHNPDIRGDQICWLEQGEVSENDIYAAFCTFLDELRLELNQALYLGLFESELHLALYPPGSRYQKHIDNFHGRSPRVVTFILYLNEDWQTGQGGQLRLYTGTDEATEDVPLGQEWQQYVDIYPQGGTLMLFLSERFYHEVLPATRERLSLTGWLRRRE